jgi:hypothetical protein
VQNQQIQSQEALSRKSQQNLYFESSELPSTTQIMSKRKQQIQCQAPSEKQK